MVAPNPNTINTFTEQKWCSGGRGFIMVFQYEFESEDGVIEMKIPCSCGANDGGKSVIITMGHRKELIVLIPQTSKPNITPKRTIPPPPPTNKSNFDIIIS
ncbi:hypothetical protein RIF29_16522 [Crotalaria pallida]|uniref:Uncharacterized protein n=1 Tax=Crotalaria pallida TaxID=3830 RepID=A0AAN9FHI2_CROPI